MEITIKIVLKDYGKEHKKKRLEKVFLFWSIFVNMGFQSI